MTASPSVTTRALTLRPWLNRAIWLAQVFTVGLALGTALHNHSRPVQLVGTALAWLGWSFCLLSLAIPHPIGLTTLRLALLSLIGCTAFIVREPIPIWHKGISVIAALAAFALLGAAETATWCVDGPAYPNEARHPLKTPVRYQPVALLLGVLITASFVALPLCIATHSWTLAGISIALTVPMAWIGVRSFHQLSTRFIVFVPAGFVVHDKMALFDPVLFRKHLVESIGLAYEGSDSLDLTLGAAGTPIEVLLREKVELTKMSLDRKSGEAGSTARFLVSPMRPGAVLQEAAARRYPLAALTQDGSPTKHDVAVVNHN